MCGSSARRNWRRWPRRRCAARPSSDDAILTEIEPAFIEVEGRRTDAVVLACTHYPFLLDRFRALAPWPVAWIDPAEAIARRVVSLLGLDEAPEEPRGAGSAYLTSGKSWPEALLPLLAGFGLEAG